MSDGSTRARVVAILHDTLGPPTSIIADEHLLDVDLGADSLDGVELTMSFEEEFKLSLSDDEVEGLASWNVGRVVTMIAGRVGEVYPPVRPEPHRGSIPQSHRAEGKNFAD